MVGRDAKRCGHSPKSVEADHSLKKMDVCPDGIGTLSHVSILCGKKGSKAQKKKGVGGMKCGEATREAEEDEMLGVWRRGPH